MSFPTLPADARMMTALVEKDVGIEGMESVVPIINLAQDVICMEVNE